MASDHIHHTYLFFCTNHSGMNHFFGRWLGGHPRFCLLGGSLGLWTSPWESWGKFVSCYTVAFWDATPLTWFSFPRSVSIPTSNSARPFLLLLAGSRGLSCLPAGRTWTSSSSIIIYIYLYIYIYCVPCPYSKRVTVSDSLSKLLSFSHRLEDIYL